MRTFTPSSWGKMLLAGIAVLVVGGPGFVLADGGPVPDYLKARTARLNGPSTVANNSSTLYTLTVFFQDGSSTVYGDPPYAPGAVFTQTAATGGATGSFSGTSTYHATHTGTVVLKGSFTSGNTTVESTRRVTIQ